jgi:hypothetical protein
MIKYETELVETLIPIKVICDACKKEFDVKDEVFEVQEFVHIREIGGYGSVFGDGESIEYDICQRCLKKLVGGQNEL